MNKLKIWDKQTISCKDNAKDHNSNTKILAKNYKVLVVKISSFLKS
jgi:hypothetical protein